MGRGKKQGGGRKKKKKKGRVNTRNIFHYCGELKQTLHHLFEPTWPGEGLQKKSKTQNRNHKRILQPRRLRPGTGKTRAKVWGAPVLGGQGPSQTDKEEKKSEEERGREKKPQEKNTSMDKDVIQTGKKNLHLFERACPTKKQQTLSLKKGNSKGKKLAAGQCKQPKRVKDNPVSDHSTPTKMDPPGEERLVRRATRKGQQD